MKTFVSTVLAASLALTLSACGDPNEVADTPELEPPTKPAEPGPLAKALEAQSAESAKQIPPEVLEVFKRGSKEIAESVDLDAVKNVGDKAPDFTLRDAYGRTVSSAELRKAGPIVVAFYRGKW